MRTTRRFRTAFSPLRRRTAKSLSSRTKRRRGVYSMELTLVLPILGIVLMALFEFSLLFFARGDVVAASRAGARKASLPGTDPVDVEQEVRRVLDRRLHNSLEVDAQMGEHTGDVVAVVVRVPMHNASPDLLWPIGFSLKNRYLLSETRMIRE